jgi:hypothetical protein
MPLAPAVKKLVLGCFVIVLVLAAAGAVATYWVYRKVSTTVSQFAELASVPELERQVRKTAAFVPPASGELTEAQVQRLVAVQRRVRERLGARFSELQRKYEGLLKRQDPGVLDLPQLVAAYRDLAATWIDAKRAQVEALNAADFSLDEYRWVRNQVYAAVGVPIMDVDVSRIIEDVTRGATTETPAKLGGAVGPGGPARNRHLIETLKKHFEENAALASFGL